MIQPAAKPFMYEYLVNTQNSPYVPGKIPEGYQQYLDSTDVEETAVPTEHGAAPVWIVRPKEKKTNGLVIFFYGAGYAMPHKEFNTWLCQRIASEAGVTVLDVAYKQSVECFFPVPVYQGYEVLRWAVKNAEMLGIDPAKIALAGESSGAGLCAGVSFVAAQKKEIPIRLQVLMYPFFGAPDEELHDARGSVLHERLRLFDMMYLERDADRRTPMFNPTYATDEELAAYPDTFVGVAGWDSLKKDGVAFTTRLINADVSVQFKNYAVSGHGFINVNIQESDQAFCDMENAVLTAFFG